MHKKDDEVLLKDEWDPNGKENRAKDALKVLVVEDNSLSFTLTSAMIERLIGVTPDRAMDGEDALEKCRDTDYDLIFMDQLMPRMSGSESSRRIRKEQRGQTHPTIVGLSGATLPRDIRQFKQSGIDYFLAKPLRLDKLQSVLHHCSSSSRMESTLAEI